MIINNVNIIEDFLWFPNKVEGIEYFYVVQLLQRKKDNPSVILNPNMRNNSNRSVYTAYIYSKDDFKNKFPLLIKLANVFQARVYINLNLKCSKDAFIKLVKNIGDRLETNNYMHLSRIYNEAVGECKGDVCKNSRWIVDIDNPDNTIRDAICGIITSLRGGGANSKGQIYARVPTKTGWHLITSSFDIGSYREREKLILNQPVDIHKDNPTILWMNTDWSQTCMSVKEI